MWGQERLVPVVSWLESAIYCIMTHICDYGDENQTLFCVLFKLLCILLQSKQTRNRFPFGKGIKIVMNQFFCLTSVQGDQCLFVFCSSFPSWVTAVFNLLSSNCFFFPSFILSSILFHQHWKPEVGAVCEQSAEWTHFHFCLHVRVNISPSSMF